MDNNKRPDDMIRITTEELAAAFIEEQVQAIQEQVGDKKVLLALSGGVDSSVVAAPADQGHRQTAGMRPCQPTACCVKASRNRSFRYSGTRWTPIWYT